MTTTNASLFTITPESVRRTILPNGLRVLVRRDVSAPVVAIVTYVSAGYFDETDDVVGIAHVLEHMYFKGTPTRGVGEIARQTKAAGGYLNAATIYDHTSYYAVVPSYGFAEGLAVQADAYANSLIDAGELARELEVIIQEAKRKADSPSAVAIETLYELLHDRHRIRRWRIGREPGLRALTRDAMVRFYRNFYHPGNTVLVIAGDVDPDDALRRVESLYGALPAGSPQRSAGPVEDGAPGFRYRELAGDIAQTQVAFGWRTPGTLHPDTPLLDVAAAILGAGRASRLYRAVRERALASGVTAYDYTPTELGVFTIHAEARPELVADAMRAIWAQLRALSAGELLEVEVERARRVLEARWVRRLEDMEGQANYLAEWESLGDWRQGEAYQAAILGATREQVIDVVRRHLVPEQASVLVFRPEATPALAPDAAAVRALLDAPGALPLDPPAPIPIEAPAVHTHAPAFEREEAGVRVYRTAAGVPIIVRRRPGAPLVHAAVFLAGGASAEEPALAGLTTLMARTALKGTTTRSALRIAEESELLGAAIAGTIGGDSAGWAISVPARSAAPAIALLGDVVQHPAFAPDALETERAVAVADVKMLRDDMYRWPMRLATEAAYAGHAYGVPSSGTEETLPRITSEHLRHWHAMTVLEGATVIGIVGDGDPAELARLADAAFPHLRGGTRPELGAPSWPSGVIQRADQRDKAQSALTLLFPGTSRSDPDRFAAGLIAGVASGLGGRFFEELRDKNSLCYTVHAFSSERLRAGAFGAYIATSPEKEDVARDGLLAEFAKLREHPVTEEELHRAKTYAMGVHAIRQQNGGAVLGDIMGAWLFGTLRELDEFEQSVRSVTSEQMRRLAERCFDPGRRVEGIVRGTGRMSS